jgi:hypothetical protein
MGIHQKITNILFMHQVLKFFEDVITHFFKHITLYIVYSPNLLQFLCFGNSLVYEIYLRTIRSFVELFLNHGDKQVRVSFVFCLPENGVGTSFRNSVVLISSDDRQSK